MMIPPKRNCASSVHMQLKGQSWVVSRVKMEARQIAAVHQYGVLTVEQQACQQAIGTFLRD